MGLRPSDPWRCFVDKIMVCGIEVSIEESERYLQINDIDPAMLSRVYEALGAKYPGFELWLCYKKIVPPEDALKELGAELLDDCVHLRLVPPDFTRGGIPENISLLELEDFEDFAAVHERLVTATDPDFYWTGRRIREAWDIWRIFVIRDNNEIIDYVLMQTPKARDYGEIFALEGPKANQNRGLLTAACACAFEMGNDQVIYMVDADDNHQYELAQGLGFKAVGFYKGYKMVL